jgi:hypothetical protein
MAYKTASTSTTVYTIGEGLVKGHPELERVGITMDSYIKQHLQDIAHAGIRLKPTNNPKEYEKLREQWEELGRTLDTQKIVKQLPKELEK